MKTLSAILPFLRWLPQLRQTWRADLVAGISVALVLVPQAMAYAQLAGVQAYYGLYAGFLPVAVAALWGSSAQLATGPVAAVSLLTASLLGAMAAPGSGEFIALAVTLALLVGLLQFALGVLRLGAIVNLLSHPVIVGFTSAAAIIIATSQLSKVFGVPMPRSDSYFADIAAVLAQVGHTHIPTFAMGAGAIAALLALKRFAPKLPGVLIVVAAATFISWATGFERNASARLDQIADPALAAVVEKLTAAQERLRQAELEVARRARVWSEARATAGAGSLQEVTAQADLAVGRLRAEELRREVAERAATLNSLWVRRAVDERGQTSALYAAANAPAQARLDPLEYRIRRVQGGTLQLAGGGEVVGAIPAGLPPFALPALSLELALSLASAAVVIALVGFMEAISIAKAMAARTRQRIDANQELIGQGLANVASAVSQGFPVSGSFSRSAVNLQAGARTGFAAVVTAALMLATLLFLTPLLYHLPQAVLAAVVIVAVLGLIDFRAIAHAWRVNRHDGIAATVTFAATLAFAPHLDWGILAGAGLAIALFVVRTMRPRVCWLVPGADGRLREAGCGTPVQAAPGVLVLRFDGQLYFGNVSYFEDSLLEAAAASPRAQHRRGGRRHQPHRRLRRGGGRAPGRAAGRRRRGAALLRAQTAGDRGAAQLRRVRQAGPAPARRRRPRASDRRHAAHAGTRRDGDRPVKARLPRPPTGRRR